MSLEKPSFDSSTPPEGHKKSLTAMVEEALEKERLGLNNDEFLKKRSKDAAARIGIKIEEDPSEDDRKPPQPKPRSSAEAMDRWQRQRDN